jgi:hypothetical protein
MYVPANNRKREIKASLDELVPLAGSDCEFTTALLPEVVDTRVGEGVVVATVTAFVGIRDVVDEDVVAATAAVFVGATDVVVVDVVDVEVVDVTHPAPPDVITRSPVPLAETATKVLFPKTTEFQLLSAADEREVHVIPSGLVITRLPTPESLTATYRPLP